MFRHSPAILTLTVALAGAADSPPPDPLDVIHSGSYSTTDRQPQARESSTGTSIAASISKASWPPSGKRVRTFVSSRKWI